MTDSGNVYYSQRFAATRRQGFSPLNFPRSTALQIYCFPVLRSTPPCLRVGAVCALNDEYKSLFNGKDTRRVKVSYARGNARSISKSQGGLK